MITRHADKAAAYKDREYWFKQGYSVAVLYPGDGDEFYTVYVDLKEAVMFKRLRDWKDRYSLVFVWLAVLALCVCAWVGAVVIVSFLWETIF